MSQNRAIGGNEFIKKFKKLAKANNLVSRVDRKRGKGSHVTLYYGNKFTILRNPKDELKNRTPIAYLTLSEDRQFIASYSTDRKIKIWGIPNSG